MGLLKTFDPMGMFCGCCLLVPLFYDPKTTNAERLEMITCPYVYGPVLLVVVMFLISHLCGKRVPLTDTESVKAGWYLFNGTIIMLLMDGFAGALQAVPLLSPQYLKVDSRYADKQSDAVMVAYVEIFMQSPACLITYLCYCWNHPLKYPMEIITCTLHFVGTIMFAVPVILNGFKCVNADWNLEFTFEHIVFFWFAYGINIMWIIVPLTLLKSAVHGCTSFIYRERESKRR